MARTAEVKRDARIGEAEARKDAQIREAIAEEQRLAARFLNDTEIAKAQRDFELKKAAYDVEVQTKVSFFFVLFSRENSVTYFLLSFSISYNALLNTESRSRNGIRVTSCKD